MSRRILVVAHNHPALHPGGTEIFAHDLAGAYREQGCEVLFLGATNTIHREPHPGTALQSVGEDVVLWSAHYDRFHMSQIDHYGTLQDLGTLLSEFHPDVIHVHHLALIGAEFLTLARRLLPGAAIVMTLHDYYPICHHDGLMVRPGDRQRCAGASPAGCHGCFPEIGADRFLLRERFIKTHLAAVDHFVAPSRFLRQRYIEWGLPGDRIEVFANARPAQEPVPHRRATGRRASFGYFGNLNPWKGVLPLLQAARILQASGESGFSLRIHGGAPFQSEAFTSALDAALAGTEGVVTHCGAYARDEVPALMAEIDWVVMPSIWWENAPLVIQEAFQHRRPLIVSDIGGMAEMVRDEIDGLHVRPGDPAALARTMRRAMEEAGLWQRLVHGIAEQPSLAACAARHLALFDSLKLAEAA
ncbi:glycosyltransferase family 4 protein [Bosea sp. SSUT16]|jgi:glycosyltransferase involved in cell wall biosynthesis|uniref:Glycosyltransferase family 4 protein n=1 Tax=Bosea spartocytisi TaxID=2773451 RepID=A0A927E9J4_9HYPH|nr:glycosyltransferase family 4 protein [Bosea spartocytisi]MBD3847248.1 glycosyltransferase family 4 protein [Bosea spartocytisi]MCT4474057.1 glycosyltransferase family 4 protein [Bosea spartocytisi]